MATSMAPPYLEPIMKQPSGGTYTNGGPLSNPYFGWRMDTRGYGSEAKPDVVSVGAGTFFLTTAFTQDLREMGFSPVP